ncbi:Uncharacterized protein TCM_043659 [Theobroma cacao]|uniref:Uncharacterized protein n=1 Tax=Theobroma cacao TaxID=3641 RepID=A0A061FQ41_THECC|nr:Uncharacterized protein TCM_043659 [Theobroma cacao]
MARAGQIKILGSRVRWKVGDITFYWYSREGVARFQWNRTLFGGCVGAGETSSAQEGSNAFVGEHWNHME